MKDPEQAAPRPQLAKALTEAHRVRPIVASGTPGRPPPRASKLWQDGGTPVAVTDIGPTSPFAAAIARRHSTRLLGPPSPVATAPGFSGRHR